VTGRQTGPIDLGIGGITEAVEIGAGGFGIVYRAVESDLGRTVAVKVLSGNLDESAQYRFERERRAMGRLSGHPNIVTIYRGGYTEAGHAYLVMEFLERGSLADWLSTAGPLGWEEVLRFGVQLSGALETSHRAGVLHRDIKPGNILLSSLGNAKLCDFGIARLQGAPETKSSVVTASLSHAPPDIVSGARPDARSDVYSLASTLFELVAANPPFVRPDDESMVPILARIARDPVPRLPETQLPQPVFEVIERAMAKDPDDRPATAVELGSLLVAAQQQLGLPSTVIPIETVGPGGDTGRSGYIPFPDSPSGPLPAPTTQSPADPPASTRPGVGPTGHPPGSGTTGDTTPPGQTAPPTIVTTPADGPGAPAPSQPADLSQRSDQSAISRETVVSGQHDPSTWAPPQVADDIGTTSGSPPDEPPGTGAQAPSQAEPARSDSGAKPGWLIPAAVALVALLAAGGAFLLLGGDDDDDGDDDVAAVDTTDEGQGTNEPDPGETETGIDDDDEDEGPASTVPGQNAEDYPFYETITDETESITINVPVEWTDRITVLGTDGLPQLVAAPLIEGGFVDSSSGPGVQVSVAAITAESERELDFVLDQYLEPGCTSAGRTNIDFPLTGRVERFRDCIDDDGGDGDAKIVNFVYTDEEQGLTAVMRIQAISSQDAVAVDTIRSSLELEDNVPE